MQISDKTKRYAIYYSVVALVIMFALPRIILFIKETIPISGSFMDQVAQFLALVLIISISDLLIRRFIVV